MATATPRPPSSEPPPAPLAIPPDSPTPDGRPKRSTKCRPSSNVRVSCRFRPPNEVERRAGAANCVEFSPDGHMVQVVNKTGDLAGDNIFTFDSVFQPSATQAEVYQEAAAPLVDDVLAGYSCTMFAYGQTGSGKTHTMMGDLDGRQEQRGIVPRIAQDIFRAMESANSATEFTVKVSFVEIYMERIRDLLNPKDQNLRIREGRSGGVALEGAEELYVASAEELLRVAERGAASRAIASTRMNQDSSRSHSVFILTVTQRELQTESSKTGRLFLVDLAGSEMVKKTLASANVLEEAKMINRSLSALGNVIKALTEGSKHVPYRDSKLTRMLQDSLGGNSKTSLVITCSGALYNATETLSTLRFGNRAKRIKNKPTINKTFSISEYKEMLGQTKETVRALGVYCRSLERRLGVEESSSPLRMRKSGGRSSFSMSDPAEFYSDTSAQPGGNEANGAGPSTDILARADEALSVALEKVDSLRTRLDETTIELDLSKSTVEGLRKETRGLEARVAAATAQEAAATRRVAELELAKEQALFTAEEARISLDGLVAENKLLRDRLESHLSQSNGTGGPEASDDGPGETGTGADEALSAEDASTRQLERKMSALSKQYKKLSDEHQRAKDALASVKGSNDIVSLQDDLWAERIKNEALVHHLMAAHAKLDLAKQTEENFALKMSNRESQIGFLEEALQGFQTTFKANVESYTEQIANLQSELSMYKRALDSLEVEAKGASDNLGRQDSGQHRIVPRVAKPIRGKAPAPVDAGLQQERRRRNSSNPSTPVNSRHRPRGDSGSGSDVPATRPRGRSGASWLLSKVAAELSDDKSDVMAGADAFNDDTMSEEEEEDGKEQERSPGSGMIRSRSFDKVPGRRLS